MKHRRSTLLSSLFFLTMLAGCADSSQDAAREHWNAAALTDYSFRYVATGFLPNADVRVEVSDNVVVAVSPGGGSNEFPLREPSDYSTIDELFDELDASTQTVSVATFDSELGYPVVVTFENASEGWGYEISEFVTR